jgi:hypothetical protein
MPVIIREIARSGRDLVHTRDHLMNTAAQEAAKAATPDNPSAAYLIQLHWVLLRLKRHRRIAISASNTPGRLRLADKAAAGPK